MLVQSADLERREGRWPMGGWVGLGRTKKVWKSTNKNRKTPCSQFSCTHTHSVLILYADILSSFPQNWLNSILLGWPSNPLLPPPHPTGRRKASKAVRSVRLSWIRLWVPSPSFVRDKKHPSRDKKGRRRGNQAAAPSRVRGRVGLQIVFYLARLNLLFLPLSFSPPPVIKNTRRSKGSRFDKLKRLFSGKRRLRDCTDMIGENWPGLQVRFSGHNIPGQEESEELLDPFLAGQVGKGGNP